MSGPLRLRAPSQDGTILAEPPLQRIPELIAGNRRRLAESSIEVGGVPLAALRRQACAAALQAANQYLHDRGEPGHGELGTGLLVSGHQPELFHTGVWVKNFALNSLARAAGATPLNLIIDNDTAKSASIHLPARTDGGYRRLSVPFDRWDSEVPYEERPVLDETLFASLPDRVAEWSRDWPWRPLLPEFWQAVQSPTVPTPLLGERLVAGRRAFERRSGCYNLELPASRLCGSDAFARFTWHLLAELPRLHRVYNDCVRAYRRHNRIRSRNHPVPDLAADGDWLEAPFWAWRAGAARRGRLMARGTAAGIELRVHQEAWPTLPRQPEQAVAAWHELAAHGYKVRSRALTTTMFARLFLADLFIHGIGGAKYDELTDALIREFFRIEPPAFLVLTGTLLLPFADVGVHADDYRRLARLVRDLHYNPQRYVNGSTSSNAQLRDLRQDKERWVGQQPTEPLEKRRRFQQIRALNDQLHVFVEDRQAAAVTDLSECERLLQIAAVLRRRDYAFCLFPQEKLRPFCTQLLTLV